MQIYIYIYVKIISAGGNPDLVRFYAWVGSESFFMILCHIRCLCSVHLACDLL